MRSGRSHAPIHQIYLDTPTRASFGGEAFPLHGEIDLIGVAPVRRIEGRSALEFAPIRAVVGRGEILHFLDGLAHDLAQNEPGARAEMARVAEHHLLAPGFHPALSSKL